MPKKTPTVNKQKILTVVSKQYNVSPIDDLGCVFEVIKKSRNHHSEDNTFSIPRTGEHNVISSEQAKVDVHNNFMKIVNREPVQKTVSITNLDKKFNVVPLDKCNHVYQLVCKDTGSASKKTSVPKRKLSSNRPSKSLIVKKKKSVSKKSIPKTKTKSLKVLPSTTKTARMRTLASLYERRKPVMINGKIALENGPTSTRPKRKRVVKKKKRQTSAIVS